jgi:Rrf2 family protein
MLSQTTEYALRAMVLLAGATNRPCSVDSIAAQTQTPPAYLSKILQSLAKAGLVRSQRGVTGGYLLNRAPDQLRVLDVINAVDPLERIRECPLGLASHGTKLCPLHRRLDNALAMVEQAFAASTLAEIIAEPSSSKPLCDFPQREPER